MTTDTEDVLTVRTEKRTEYVKLVTLDVGDEFETDSTGGTVAWVINNGSAQAVGVIFDGHTTDISIAPGMMVKVRKKAPVAFVHAPQMAVSTEQQKAEEALFDDAAFGALESMNTVSDEDPLAEGGVFVGPLLPITGCAALAEYCKTDSEYAATAQTEARVFREPLPIEVVPVCPASKIIRIISLDTPSTPAPAATTLPVCNFDLTLNEQEIILLHFSSATDLFCRGLYFSWTKDTFFEAAKKHFPSLKCGQDREACMRQIALYRATLRKSGKLG